MNKSLVKNSGIALTSGILIAFMVTVNGLLAKKIGNWPAVIIIHVAGLLSTTIVLLLKKSLNDIFKGVPLLYLSGGAFGVVTVFLNNLCVNNIGVTMTLGLALVGQILASGIIEHLGILGMKKNKFRLKKVPAYILMTAGAIVMIVWG